MLYEASMMPTLGASGGDDDDENNNNGITEVNDVADTEPEEEEENGEQLVATVKNLIGIANLDPKNTFPQNRRDKVLNFINNNTSSNVIKYPAKNVNKKKFQRELLHIKNAVGIMPLVLAWIEAMAIFLAETNDDDE